jgi:alkylhydroperoxidase family enzyme
MADRVTLVPLEQALSLAREIGVPEATARLSAFRILANHPGLAKGIFAQHLALRYHNKLPTRLRELMIMRIAWQTGSEYEWTQHWQVATDAGIPEDVILAVRDWRASASLSAAERAALAAVDDTLEHGSITDAVWTQCAAHIGGPAELIEMVVAIGHWNSFSQLLQSLSVPLAEGTPGWPPDGKRPAPHR